MKAQASGFQPFQSILALEDEIVAAPLPEADFVLDGTSRRVLSNGRSVRLTETEFRLLAALADQRGTVLGRDSAIAAVWGRGFRGCRRALDVYVSRLRGKLRHVITLETQHGVGYRLV